MLAWSVIKLATLALLPSAVIGGFVHQQIHKEQYQQYLRDVPALASVTSSSAAQWIEQVRLERAVLFTNLAVRSGYALAKQTNGLIVALEHRYYGDSNPFSDYATQNLRFLASEQAVEDAATFARNFTTSNNLPSCTKWIPVGGSYPGNLAAWFREIHPEIFWAAHSSSAPLTAKIDFWEYSYAVHQGIPKIAGGSQVCADNLARLTTLFDKAIVNDPEGTRLYLGLGTMELDGDVGSFLPSTALAGSIQYGPVGQQFNATVTQIDAACSGKYFPSFADPKATDSQLWSDLQAYVLATLANYGITPNNDTQLLTLETLSLQDPSNSGRLWYWQTCNEFGYFQDAEHIRQPIYSRTINVDYYTQACDILFEGYDWPDTQDTNALYKATDIKTDRIVFVNGAIDPWHWLGIFNRTSTPAQPTFFHDQFHCGDLFVPLQTDSPLLIQIKGQIMATWINILSGDTCPSQVKTCGGIRIVEDS
ncbi:serine carboxypeptidase S28-domain-containing protein [Polychytrium aggregatum]|uniref:serine carboxypeptidase S28-domain-containing protein n=1 Tax=Polychytrium aggregatum TaxID=110093 RepID=UPI0022FF43E4|nr:serine carboxypeptidase S28-domain-containing protein [Polychytrium aggregatum]KAI9204556.1 serine carboxypeptidase S28-domain-containing protein [Polychytrium aggregatum]